jgi:peptide/nickel transport system ATP-binding protein
MQQRVMIAMALACRPRLLIADEPTTALDVTIQAQIIDLLVALQRELDMAVLLITHNLGLVAGVADQINVMYAGRIVEAGPATEVLGAPAHPYTRALLEAVPRLEAAEGRLRGIEGQVPGLGRLPAGCRFHPGASNARRAVARKTRHHRRSPAGAVLAAISRSWRARRRRPRERRRLVGG